jgi:hypothetical protein
VVDTCGGYSGAQEISTPAASTARRTAVQPASTPAASGVPAGGTGSPQSRNRYLIVTHPSGGPAARQHR